MVGVRLRSCMSLLNSVSKKIIHFLVAKMDSKDSLYI